MDEGLSLGQQLAAKRRPKERQCARCGTAFTTVGRGLYCSNKCRSLANWHKHQERKRGQQDGG